ncbi:MAG: ABC transporter ATP-binding protein/permease [Rikenellaceae bacterium]|jgi:ABC-type multidrug transport system fused ATPase/permease subunit|nr:ABC transporter ATP-binding protein/permease [Rikenellaceae bacterium]
MIAVRIFRSLPDGFRRRSLWVVVSIVAGALLDLAGVATLFPLLLLIARPEAPEMLRVANMLGVTDMHAFTLTLGFGAAGLLTVKNLVTAWLAHNRTKYLTQLCNNLSDRLFTLYYRRGLLFIRERHTADLTMNITTQCHNYVWGLLRPMLSLLGGAIVMSATIALFLVISLKATLLLIACLTPVVWIYFVAMRRRLERCGREDFRARREQMRGVMQSLRAYAEVQIAGALAAVQGRFRDNQNSIARNRLKIEALGRLPIGMMEVGVTLCIALLLVVRPENLLATLTLFGVAAVRMLPTLRQMMGDWSSIRQNSHTLNVTDEAAEQNAEPESPREPITFEREIVIDNLSFSYGDSGNGARKVISDLSFVIHKGDRLAIKGVSGAGKSTLLNILLGFFPPGAGRVLIDGVPLTDATGASWRAGLGYVPQEVYLLEGTLAENIAPGVAPELIDRDKIGRVIEQVRLAAKVASLSGGIDTPLGENGCRLSGGERQRVGIARALYKGAETLILDEATSAVDRATEQSIADALESLAADNPCLTIIAVSHRDLPFRTREITI